MTDVWSERAAGYRASRGHREGADLDRLVELAEPGAGVVALDVATGGGHVARRLREAGADVVSSDPAPGMQPDVLCRAEDLPFADESFDVVTCRIAPHHFDDVAAGVREMARVSRDRVVIEDTLYEDEKLEEAFKLHDPTHVRCYTEDEWRKLFEQAGLRVDTVEFFEKRRPLDEWLARTGCNEEEGARIRELLAERVSEDGTWADTKILLRGRKR